jgi:hypothetical protein
MRRECALLASATNKRNVVMNEIIRIAANDH